MNRDKIDAISDHYNHARRKHPYFADFWTMEEHDAFERQAKVFKHSIRNRAKCGEVSARIVLEAEIAEVFEAIMRGDMTQAKEEIYDAVAVLLRMANVIDGTEKFGDPAKADRRCANHDCRSNDSRGVCMRRGGRCRCGNCPMWDCCEVSDMKAEAK